MPDEITSAEIRPATSADAAAIAEVRRASWLAAYDGLIDRALIDRATLPAQPWAPPPYRRTLVALAPPDGQAEQLSAGAAPDNARVVVGFASFGPERTVDSAVLPSGPVAAGPSPAVGALRPGDPNAGRPRDPKHGISKHSKERVRQPAPAGPLTAAGLAGETGEVYAIYLAPAAWSTGTGRALMDAALAGLRADGYRRVVLWVLTGNARARRFYHKAGFAPDGATNILVGLGGVEELRYARVLAH